MSTAINFKLTHYRPLPHMIMAGAMASLIGLLLFSCFLLSHPFRGPIAISPE
ncbi:MAG: hypothetical protein ABSF98_04780 [Bryobacteraceae bacterium]|jgi:hypothetical protein